MILLAAAVVGIQQRRRLQIAAPAGKFGIIRISIHALQMQIFEAPRERCASQEFKDNFGAATFHQISMNLERRETLRIVRSVSTTFFTANARLHPVFSYAIFSDTVGLSFGETRHQGYSILLNHRFCPDATIVHTILGKRY
ncbi:hypothetical protein KM043_000664 [Ampulex compressa]|nr:hypothetical protein KM043_000664 [Ampulex compressa]